jgi:hypothetical protein
MTIIEVLTMTIMTITGGTQEVNVATGIDGIAGTGN